ncbi:hypothetical protein GEMRC1_012821 [Eukaryota sp. GEM-RC1]
MSNPQDRFHLTSQLEHLQARQTDSISADSSRHDWAVQVHRDTHAAFLGNRSLLHYIALAEGQHPIKAYFSRLEYMLNPCGPRPTSDL